MTNPYESPQVPPEPCPPSEPHLPVSGRKNVGTSVILILLGLIFLIANGHLLLKGSFADLLAIYRRGGGSVSVIFFYCLAGGLTSVFHISYLIGGRPTQQWAGIWALGIALALTGLTSALLSLIGG